MAAVQHPWTGRAGWPVRPTLLRVSHDVLLEIVCLLDVYSLLSMRRVCRMLSAITRENIIFMRLLKRPFPPPVPGSSPEERVIRTYRLHKNWDLAALPITARTHRGDTVTRIARRQFEPIQAPVPIAAPPLAYHLPPDQPAPIPISFPTLPVDGDLTEATRSLAQAQVQHITQHQSEPGPLRPPLASNFAATVVRAWGATQSSVVSPLPVPNQLAPPPAPAPRPTRVSSLPLRAIFAKIVGGGRWGVFVIKRDANVKGKQRADSQPLTTEALDSLGKGKGKEREPVEAQTQPLPVDEEAFLVVYDLDEVLRGSGKDPERGQVAEHTLKMTPSTMTCRTTEKGLVVVLVKSATTGAGAGTSWTTILRWDYISPGLKGLSMHKSSCMLGAMSIAELEVEKDQPVRTLVAIVHRPRTVMIQDVDSGQRSFVKLGKVPPVGSTMHLIPGPRLLVLRSTQAEQAMCALEEYEVPPMGETSQPTVPLQRQWIRSPDLQNCTIIEGPTYGDGSLPDLALWTFETAPHRAVTHWLLRSVSAADDSSMDVDLGHDPPVLSSVDSDVYTPGTAPYVFPAQKICTSRLSFPHHKVTFAPGARRGMWFERPERSRSGQARGMRGVWGYTAIQADCPVVRSCTSELPEDVLGAMENNTLGVAFDELSGRMVAITCGDGYSALTGSQVWVLDYA
ncbi:unnamed protein product [Rhizoctonia solani]|uniref:F-box domain-containing protein n=1 Tax=Rhizoctonia solani TaxID=456999 RepID=A0A8H3BFS3_9AGAM|nr:unnamed protein product [Rhizoctonia solani]